MTTQTIIVLCSLVWISMGLFNNCVQFNPSNFNACIRCAQKYYLVSGKCYICTDSTSNKPECASNANTADKKLDTNTAQTNQVNSTQGASGNNQGDSKSVKSTAQNVAPKQSQKSSSDTQASRNQTLDSSTNSTNSTNSSQSTNNSLSSGSTNTDSNAATKTTANVTSTVKPTPAATLSLSIFALLNQQGLINCSQFTVTSEGIRCSVCQDGFNLTPSKLCVSVTNNDSKQPTTNIDSGNQKVISSSSNSNQSSTPSNNDSLNTAKTSSSESTKPTNSTDNSTITKGTTLSTLPISPFISFYSQPTIESQQTTTIPTQVPSISVITTNSFYSTPNNDVSTFTPSVDITSNMPKNNLSLPQTTSSAVVSNQSTLRYPTPNKPKDPNCAQFNSNFSQKVPISRPNCRCFGCYKGFYYNVDDQICQPSNQKCQTIDDQNNCLSCFPGYSLSNGDCIVGSGLTILNPQGSASSYKQPDPNCRRCTDSNVCLICAVNFYLWNGICKQADPLCQTYNSTTGDCLTCYKGYQLNTTTQPISCTICSTLNQPNGKQTNLSCPTGSYLSNGSCLLVSPLCKTYNKTTGSCLSCYTGYELSVGVCSLIRQIQDPFCYIVGSLGCYECIDYYYPDTTGVCQPVNGLCYGYDKRTGDCTGCYYGYKLAYGQCVWQYAS